MRALGNDARTVAIAAVERIRSPTLSVRESRMCMFQLFKIGSAAKPARRSQFPVRERAIDRDVAQRGSVGPCGIDTPKPPMDCALHGVVAGCKIGAPMRMQTCKLHGGSRLCPSLANHLLQIAAAGARLEVKDECISVEYRANARKAQA